MSLSHSLTWMNAAWREAARLREPEVDIEHFFLGLLAQGGDAAERLATQGVSLASARHALAEERNTSLRSLGIDHESLERPAPRPLHDLHADTVGELPLSARAKTFTDQRHDLRDSVATLAALIDEPSGTVRRLLERLGVDLARISVEADHHPQYLPRRTTPDPGVPGHTRGFRTTHFISAPPALVAAVIAAPETLSAFAFQPENRLPGEPIRARYGRGRHAGVLRFACDSTESLDVREVTWTAHLERADRGDETSQVDRFAITERAGGSAITHTRTLRTFAPLGRLVFPVTGRLNALGIPWMLQNIAFAVADRT